MTRFWSGVARVFELSFGQLLWSRRTLFLTIIVGAPVVIAVAARLVAVNAPVRMSINGSSVGGDDLFGTILGVLFLRFVVPVVGVWYGTSLIADEVENKTITYLFVRPIRRGAVLLGKYFAYLACTNLLILPAVVVVHVALLRPSLLHGGLELFNNLAVLSLGLAAYGALFAFMGAALKRPLVVGFVFAFGWEQAALVVPGYLRRLTLAYHLEATVLDISAAVGSLFWLLVMTVTCLILATQAVERREYVLEQSR